MPNKWLARDIANADILKTEYDLAILACGYEKRSIYLSTILDKNNIKNHLICGFTSSSKNETFLSNKDYYTNELDASIVYISIDDPSNIIDEIRSSLERFNENRQSVIKIIIDYSSMPRLWYAEILNFIKNYDTNIEILIDFSYSVGEHNYSLESKQLSTPIVLPGCESVSAFDRKTVAIFGLGFDGGAPLCLHGKVEPDKAFSLIAKPGALTDYAERTARSNKFFLENLSDEVVYSSLFSVQQCYSTLREVFYPYINSASVVIIPFGPKPHGLASILAAMNYPEVSCLYSSTGSRDCAVTATGELVLTRLSLTEYEL